MLGTSSPYDTQECRRGVGDDGERQTRRDVRPEVWRQGPGGPVQRLATAVATCATAQRSRLPRLRDVDRAARKPPTRDTAQPALPMPQALPTARGSGPHECPGEARTGPSWSCTWRSRRRTGKLLATQPNRQAGRARKATAAGETCQVAVQPPSLVMMDPFMLMAASLRTKEMSSAISLAAAMRLARGNDR